MGFEWLDRMAVSLANVRIQYNVSVIYGFQFLYP